MLNTTAPDNIMKYVSSAAFTVFDAFLDAILNRAADITAKSSRNRPRKLEEAPLGFCLKS